MAELKTKPTDASVKVFINTVEESRREDCKELVKLMERATGAKPVMWGDSIIGFGSHYYMGSRGRGVDWFVAGFSPRKQDFSLYFLGGLDPDLMKQLGKHKMSGGCLHIKKLADVNIDILEQIVIQSVMRARAQSA
jgi:hypothetical protein